MEKFLTLYRKYRPQTFKELVGQQHIVKMLQNAIGLNRVSHAYLFAGLKGSGKTTVARLLAKALNCQTGPTPEPCGTCDMCRKIASGQLIDVMEIDAASNRGIDDIRDLREGVNFVPMEARYKIYIIDEVHMLTTAAFNALLKTLEEPPAQTVFILATTEPEKIPATIMSRVQELDFRKISDPDITATLEKIARQEKVSVDKAVLGLITAQSEGSLRNAISLLDLLMAYKKDNVTVEDFRFILGAVSDEFLDQVLAALIGRDYPELLKLLDGALSEGRNFNQVLGSLTEYFRLLLLIKLGGDLEILTSEKRKQAIGEMVKNLPLEYIKEALRRLSAAFMGLRIHPQPQLYLELALLDIMELCSTLPEQQAVTPLPAAATPSKVAEKTAEVPSVPSSQPVTSVERISRMRIELTQKKPISPEPEIAPNNEIRQKSEANQNSETTQTTEARQNPVAPVPDKQFDDPGNLSLMKTKQLWTEFLEKVRLKSYATYMVINEGQLIDVQNDKLILKYPRNHSFHLEKLKETETRKTVDDTLRELFGPKARLEAIIESGSGPAGAPVAARQTSAAVNFEAGQLARSFGGKVVSINNHESKKEQ